MKEILIDPITRLEGHGNVSIFLNDKGDVENAYLKIPELRGFEKFCIGRRAELMPILTTRICGVCPVAHHYAAVKALDQAFNVEPPSAAKKLRELQYVGYYIYDHTLHFYYLGGPDFIVGPDAPAEKRNILGVIEKAGMDVAKEVIKHRAYGQKNYSDTRRQSNSPRQRFTRRYQQSPQRRKPQRNRSYGSFLS